MLDIDDLIDFKNKWFYLAIATTLLTSILGINISSKVENFKNNLMARRICFVFLFLFFVIDNVVSIIAIIKCPHAFISYFWSVYLPLFLLPITVIGCGIDIIIKLAKYGCTSMFLSKIDNQMLFLVFIKVSYALAYGSIFSIIWILIDYMMVVFKLMLIPDPYDYDYEKKNK